MQPILFTPFQIGSLTLKNRLVMAPMCMYSANPEGVAQSFHLSHYTARAFGGASLIVQEATSVESRGRISNHDLGLWHDQHIPMLKRVVEAVHDAGSKMAIQLAHAGRKCGVKSETLIAPSALIFSEQYPAPGAMTLNDIHEVQQAFKSAAKRAQDIGYDGIEIHGAHGYLINQFLSPLSNHRTDAYGGSLLNRTRFLLEILQAVRSVFHGPVWVRLSADEYHPEGHHIDETIQVIHHLQPLIDAVNVSSGGAVPFPIQVTPGYQIPLAKKIKEALTMTVIGGGLVKTYEEVTHILENEKLDAIYLGRELLLNPYWLLQQAKKHHPEAMLKAYDRG
jgi:NADPH2 dehydrogenase